MRIIQYKTAALLTNALTWKPGDAPAGDEAPYSWAGLNVLIEMGPISARAPSAPETDRQTKAASIFAILDPLLWPIVQHSVVTIPGRTAAPTAGPPATAAPSKAPVKSAAPSKSP